MRPVVLLAALLILLVPTSATNTALGQAAPHSSSNTIASHVPISSSNAVTSNDPPTGLIVILRSVFGIAFYNSSGSVTIQPAFMLMNMTVTGSNSTGTSFSINSGPSPISKPVSYITIGPSSVVTVRRLFTVTSGQAFLTSYGHLTIQALMLEVLPCQPGCMVPNQIYNLYLTGPARIAPPPTMDVFTRLFGFLYTSQTRIGLFFVVGISSGDINEDGIVDITDLTLVASTMGTNTVQSSMTSSPDPSTGYSSALYCDMNGDGHIDIDDLVIVAANNGHSY